MSLPLKAAWPLLCILTVFIVCKVPHLYYPFYWDESWSYAPALNAMYHHGISLLPDVMDPELSRGHPLLFHVLAVAWMNVFGTSHFALHSFALATSVLFIATIYLAGAQLYNRRVAVIATLLVTTQEVFFVQSSFLLPEVQVAFFAFLSLCFYVKDKYLLTALCLTALFYTKESGMVMGAVLGIDACILLFNNSNAKKDSIYRLASVVVPCILIALFFIQQKHVRGWYLFPEHTRSILQSWDGFWYSFRMGALRFNFYEHYRYRYFLILLTLAFAAAIKNVSLRFMVIFIPAIVIYYLVDDMHTGRFVSSLSAFIIFIFSVAILLYVLGSDWFFEHIYQRRFIMLSGIFILCFFCFCCINPLTGRYMLAAIIPLLVLTGIFLDIMITYTYNVLSSAVLLSVFIIGYCSFNNDNNCGDIDLCAFDGMDVQANVVNYFEKDIDQHKTIAAGSFLERVHLTSPATGFLHADKVFNNVKWDINDSTDYAIFDNIEPDYRYRILKQKNDFSLVFRTQKGKMWAEVYAKK